MDPADHREGVSRPWLRGGGRGEHVLLVVVRDDGREKGGLPKWLRKGAKDGRQDGERKSGGEASVGLNDLREICSCNKKVIKVGIVNKNHSSRFSWK